MLEELTLQAQEARRDYKRQYRVRNREKINRQQREWRADNPERVKEYQKRYWEKKAKNPRASWKDYGINKERLNELWEIVKSGKYADMVLSAACAAHEKAAGHILLSVKESLSYEYLEYHEKLGRCPLGRTDFYGYRRLFFHYLNRALNDRETMIQEEHHE